MNIHIEDPIKDLEPVNVDVANLNEKYAVVIIGDKTVVMQPTENLEIKFLGPDAFKTWLANRFVTITNDDGKEVQIPLAKYWLTHPQRRQYEGIVFAPKREVPGHYNLWRGFAVEPRPGDCSKFLAHIKDNVCRGNAELCQWVMGWFAAIVQQPDKKIGTALVLRGKQGVGKTIVGKMIGALFGPHYVLVSDPRYVTGRFNSHLASCLLLHADEGFWAGDHAAEGKLKDLVTGDIHYIEYKNKEAFRIANYVRLLVTGNPEWIVPAGFEERRFAVLDVGEGHIQDIPYFAAIEKEMENGGREALLDYLLKFKVDFNALRVIPKTDALLEQKLATLVAIQSWWLDVLTRGELPSWGFATNCCPTQSLCDAYVAHAGRHGTRHKASETQLGMFLHKHAPNLGNARLRRDEDRTAKRTPVYVFPPLADCRKAFTKMIGQTIAWGEPEEWEQGSIGPVGF